MTLVYGYFVVLAALVIVSAVIWAIWGMGAASIVLFMLSIGLIASWIIL